MKTAYDNTTKFEYKDKEGEIVIITHTFMGPLYQFEVYTDRSTALLQLWNAYRCDYTIIFCSDEELMKEHKLEVASDTWGP